MRNFGETLPKSYKGWPGSHWAHAHVTCQVLVIYYTTCQRRAVSYGNSSGRGHIL